MITLYPKNILAALCVVFTSLLPAQNDVRSLTLDECITIAKENNLNIKSSVLDLELASINTKAAKATRLPSFNVGGNYGFNWGRGIDPTTNNFTNQRIHFNGLSGTANLTIFNGLQQLNNVKKRQLLEEVAGLDYLIALNNLGLNVAASFLDIALKKELLNNQRLLLTSSERQLERTKKLVEGGILPKSNELQLTSQYATNEVNVIMAENNFELALLTLKQILLIAPSTNIDVAIPNIDINSLSDNLTIASIYQEALGTQPEIKKTSVVVKSATKDVKIAKGGYYPSLSMNVNLGTNFSDNNKRFNTASTTPVFDTLATTFTASGEKLVNVSFPTTFETKSTSTQYDENFFQRLSFSVSVPLFNGLNQRTMTERSLINLKKAQLGVQQQENQLYQNIEIAYRNFVATRKTLAATEKEVAALDETYRAIEAQYNLGAANSTDFQVALNNLYVARSSVLRAKYDYIFKRKIIDYYRGIFF